jgi:DHA2 family multidrug resistance protein-like MFS transporter
MSNGSDDVALASRRDWAGLAVLALATLLVSVDLFVMLLALPHITESLHSSAAEQLWVVDMYGFMLAGFLITMGTLGDRIGRRKLMLIGAASFGIASLLAAFASNPGMLIAARALLGIAGATLAPTALSLINHIFKDAKQRASAIGVWLACLMGGAVIGPVIGGVLLEYFWWGSVFLLAIPPMLLLLILGPKLLPEYRNPKAGRLHWRDVFLSLLSILPVVYGIKEMAREGWMVFPVISILVGLMIGAVFIRRQLKMPDPLLNLHLFRNKKFSVTLLVMLCNTMLPGGVMIIITQHLQLVADLSPLRAGLLILPAAIASILSFQIAPLLARRIRPARLIAAGLGVSVIGLLILTQVSATGGLPALIIGFVLFNLGAGPLVTLGTNIIMSSVPPEEAGQAAGISQTSNEFGFALGIAVVGSIAAAVYHSSMNGLSTLGIPPDMVTAAHDTAAGAFEAASHLTGSAQAILLDRARESLTLGLHTAAGVSAVIILGAAILIGVTLKNMPVLGKK